MYIQQCNLDEEDIRYAESFPIGNITNLQTLLSEKTYNKVMQITRNYVSQNFTEKCTKQQI